MAIAAVSTARRGPVVWVALSLTAYLAGSLGIFVVNAVVGAFGNISQTFEMAEWSVVWGALALAGVLFAGRLAFGRWLRVGVLAVAVALPGVFLSATLNAVLEQWATARFGVMDADYIGSTAGLFAVLIGVAVAGFGVYVAPRHAVGWPLGFVVVGFAMTAVILAANLPGLADGIDPESWPLAIWLGISGIYAAIVTIACALRARGPAATPER
jgi:hypothetical protein